MDVKLIKIVSFCPWLYDKSSKEFNNSKKKASSWKEIGKAMNMSADMCNERWTAIRSRYFKEKKILAKAGSSGTNHPWPLFECMQFLNDRIDQKKSRSVTDTPVKTEKATNFYHGDRKLIELVRNFPSLYVKSKDDCKEKDKSWKTVAGAMLLSVDECKTKWAVLRSRYVMEKRKICLRGESPLSSSYPLWVHFNAFKFLDEHIQYRKSRDDISPETDIKTEVVPQGDGKLIEIVESYPCLYDQNRTDFKNFLKKEKLWKDIGNVMGISDIECKNRWAAIRTKYGRVKKKLGLLNEDTSYNDPWPHFQACHFLEQHVKERQQRSNVKDAHLLQEVKKQRELGETIVRQPDASSRNEEELAMEVDSPGALEDSVYCADPNTMVTAELTEVPEPDDLDRAFSSSLKEVSKLLKPNELDVDGAFGLSITESLRRLPKGLKITAKKKIFKIIRQYAISK